VAQVGNLVISSEVSDYMDGGGFLIACLNSIEDDSMHDGRTNLARRDIHDAQICKSSTKEFNSNVPITSGHSDC
jgi:hypothetical protein